jgi:iron complex outermembrane recepter protein
MRNFCRTLTMSMVAALVAAGALAFADVQARSVSYDLNIPAEDLTAALQSFAIVSHHKLLYKAELTAGKSSRALKGRFTAHEAMDLLLSGTGLSYEITGSSVVLIKNQTDAKTSDLQGEAVSPMAVPSSPIGGGPPVLMAQDNAPASSPSAEARGAANPDAASTPSGEEKSGLAEIIVTANKRAENLQDIGAGISVVSDTQLDTLQANSLADYIQQVPGVAMQSLGAAGYGAIEIRGISPQSVGATVATYIDDIPVGGSSAVAEGGEFTPDLDPADIQRVEVLKGPQGTLYGASSLGGVIKYVTKQPSLTGSEGNFTEEIENVDHGQLGGKVRGSYSTPVTDELAVRVSGYYRWIPGYIDDLGISGKNANNGTDWGLRGTVLWKPTGELSVNFNAMTQQLRQNGFNTADYNPTTQRPIYGSLDEFRYTQEYFEYKTDLFSVEVNYETPYGSFLSATSYSDVKPVDAGDATYDLEGLANIGPNNPAQYVSHHYDNQETEELRFTSKRLGNFEFLAGAFFQHESLSDGDEFLTYEAGGRTIDTTAPNLGDAERAGTLQETAGFLNATYYVLPTFDLTVGYRYSDIKQDEMRISQGLLYVGDETTVQYSNQTVNQTASTYLADARLHVTSDVMLYLRAASGYRPGGVRAAIPGAPPDFSPYYTSDSIWSYETGIKAKALDGKLTVDADAFWIDWSNIQTLVYIGYFNTDGNGGHAVSRGLELQSNYVPIHGLSLKANAAWTDAIFNSTDASVHVVAGQRLYYVPELQGSVGADYSWPIGRYQADVGADWNYTGAEYDNTNYLLPSYSLVNIHTGLKWDRLSLNLFVKNATDKHALVGDTGYFPGFIPWTVVVNQPLTVGLSFSQHF